MACEHEWKLRLIGQDARLWRCADMACNALFVEGRTWLGEPAWILLGDFRCVRCLDGLCTSVDDAPCPSCGTASARPKAGG